MTEPAIKAISPIPRVGDAGELKGVAVFLAADASNYITGQTIVVDGGGTTSSARRSTIRSHQLVQPSPISHQPSATTNQPPPISHHQSAITNQPSPISHQHSSNHGPQSAIINERKVPACPTKPPLSESSPCAVRSVVSTCFNAWRRASCRFRRWWRCSDSNWSTSSIGRVVFAGTAGEQYYNGMGVAHGGWAATLIDSALGCAINSTQPPGRVFTTVELKINYTRPLTREAGEVRCTGTVIHIGTRTATAEARVVDNDGLLYAHGTTTCLVIV